MYEITIERHFAASHALRLPGGVEPMHRHDWPVWVTVATRKLDAMECVMDFHDLEQIVEDVLAPLDGQVLNEIEPFDETVNPSAERVAWYIGKEVDDALPDGVDLLCVTVGEADGCKATWRAG